MAPSRSTALASVAAIAVLTVGAFVRFAAAGPGGAALATLGVIGAFVLLLGVLGARVARRTATPYW